MKHGEYFEQCLFLLKDSRSHCSPFQSFSMATLKRPNKSHMSGPWDHNDMVQKIVIFVGGNEAMTKDKQQRGQHQTIPKSHII